MDAKNLIGYRDMVTECFMDSAAMPGNENAFETRLRNYEDAILRFIAEAGEPGDFEDFLEEVRHD